MGEPGKYVNLPIIYYIPNRKRSKKINLLEKAIYCFAQNKIPLQSENTTRPYNKPWPHCTAACTRES